MTAFRNTLLLSTLFAAAHAAATQAAVARDLPDGLSIPNDIILWGNYEYAGCWTDDSPITRSLTVLSESGDYMTIENCLQFCNEREGYYNLAYVGLEYSRECYCDWVLQDTAVQVDDSECNMPCAGNASQPCGAGNRLTLLSLGGSPTTAPETLLLSTNWTYQGCYQDSVSDRLLPFALAVSYPQFFTLEQCAYTCGQAGYTYAGIEYRNECHCGSSLPTDAVLESDNDCGMACIYDYFERCGGPNRISVYKSS